MLEFPIKRTIIIDDSKKKKGRKKKGDGEKTVIRGTVNLPKKEPLKKLDKLPKNAKNLVIVESPAKAKTIERFLATSYEQFAANSRIVTWLPLMVERFARQRLHALAKVETYTPPTAFPAVDSPKGEGVGPAAAAIVAGVAGLAVGAGAMALRGMDDKTESDRDSGQGG